LDKSGLDKMKTLHLSIIIGLSIVTLQAFATDMPSSTPENVGNDHYSYTDNTPQLQFIIPAVVVIISIITGIAIYSGVRSK
jgi:hypothetical protein